MAKSYEAQVFSFGKDDASCTMTYGEAAACIRDGNAAAIILDMIEPRELTEWWEDSAFPSMTQHKNFPWARGSGLSIGPTQHLVKEELMPGLMNYFSYAGKVNAQLKQTGFVKFCMHELNITPVSVDDWAELPLASRREFLMNTNSIYSVPPHCDAIHFGRDTENWPIQESFSEGYDQLSTFITVQEAQNRAGLILWNLWPKSRSEIDELVAEFSANQCIQRLEGRPSLTVRARAGQMTILNSRYLHAVENCSSARRTIGAFLVWHDNGWRMFQ